MPDLTGEDIRRVRELQGLSQREFAVRLGLLTAQSVSDAEREKSQLNPTALMLIAEWQEELVKSGKWSDK